MCVTAQTPQTPALTDTLGRPLTPLGDGCVTVVASEQAGSRQHVALVADVLHRGANQEAGRHHPTAVLHHAWVWTGDHWSTHTHTQTQRVIRATHRLEIGRAHV